MEKIYLIVVLCMLCSNTKANTYTLTSGKWSEIYDDSCVDEGIEVRITGTVILDRPIMIEGTLTIEDKAMLIGLERITITESGRLCNEGVIMAERLSNKGTVQSKHAISFIDDVSNSGTIDNGDLMIAGKSIDIGKQSNITGPGSYITNDLKVEENDEAIKPNIRYAGRLTKTEDSDIADPSKWEDGDKAPTGSQTPPKL